MTFEPDYKKLFRKMREEGRMVSISQEGTYRLNHQLAMRFAPVKEEFYRKERASRYYTNKLESISAEI